MALVVLLSSTSKKNFGEVQYIDSISLLNELVNLFPNESIINFIDALKMSFL